MSAGLKESFISEHESIQEANLSNHEKLIYIQSRLKAPKNQQNKFGNYKYRSCEDILEGVKPLLQTVGFVLILQDNIQCIEGRFYVQAKAILKNKDGKIVEEAIAYAREENNKKGMDASQITGAASSYARKYALNGLLLIDDTKDADTQPPHVPIIKSIGTIKNDLAKIITIKELTNYYKQNKSILNDNAIVLLKQRKLELKEINHDE